MIDYKYHTISEAVALQITRQFLLSVKAMDTNLAANRITALINGNGSDIPVLTIMAHFNSLVGTITSGDER